MQELEYKNFRDWEQPDEVSLPPIKVIQMYEAGYRGAIWSPEMSPTTTDSLTSSPDNLLSHSFGSNNSTLAAGPDLLKKEEIAFLTVRRMPTSERSVPKSLLRL
jgi:hypothetical protein